MDAQHSKRAWVTDALWLLVCAGASSVWCVTAAAELGATFDEPVYLRAGLEGWRQGTHSFLLRVGTMPLPADTATLPLYLWERATGNRFDLNQPYGNDLFFWMRAASLPFWWMLLFFSHVVARHLAGPWAGRLAVASLACDPNFVAHAALATTDIAAAAFLLPTVYYFAKGRNGSWRQRIGMPGLWFGAALFAKASALAYAPICWACIEVHRLLLCGPAPLTRPTWASFRHFLRDASAAGAVGILFVFLLCGCDWQPEPSFVRWAQALPDSQTKETMLSFAENLKLFSNAGSGLVYQIRHNLRGHASYLLGEMAERSIWYYYPVLLAIKLPLPALLLPLLMALLRPRALCNWACLIAAVMAVYSLTCHVQVGIRLMFPWIAIGMVGLAAACVTAIRETTHAWQRGLLTAATLAGVVWTGLSTISLWPHGLCYVNELWGNPREAYQLVSDSNFDWGQGLKELARWQRDHEVPDLDVWYMGTDPLLVTLPMRRVNLESLSRQEILTRFAGRHLAVSTTYLYGSYIRASSEALPLLRSMRPVGRTQTFLIFQFDAQEENPQISMRWGASLLESVSICEICGSLSLPSRRSAGTFPPPPGS